MTLSIIAEELFRSASLRPLTIRPDIIVIIIIIIAVHIAAFRAGFTTVTSGTTRPRDIREFSGIHPAVAARSLGEPRRVASRRVARCW